MNETYRKAGGDAWGHSVADLLRLLEQDEGTPAVPNALFDAALELDKAYIPTRYPDAHPFGFPRQRYTKIET